MNRYSLRLAAAAALAIALTAPSLAFADEDEPYRDAAQVREELVKVLTCQAKRADFMRLANALTPVYYGKPAQPALAGWAKAEDANAFVALIKMPEPVKVYGHPTRQLMMAGEGMLAVLDGDHADALAAELKLAPSSEPLARHIRSRELRKEPLGDGVEAKINQTVSTLTTHPGKTMVGCEYRMFN